VFRSNARPGIGHREDQAAVSPKPHAHADTSSHWRVAHRVADQVAHGAEEFIGRAGQIAIKSTVKHKLVIGLTHCPYHLRQSLGIRLKMAHQGRQSNASVQPRRGAAFKP